MKQIELLAPAKDLESGITAIKCGADAVYIGAGKFGARVSAGNNFEDIEKLIQFAHFYRAKVYITVNTILNDDEIIQAQKLIKKLYEIGADALIIQDMGLLELELPPMPVFASTQCHNNTPEKIDFLEKTGFNRAILARELSLEQIKEIRSRTNIGLESFIHGALCVCYSGQCYMSYAIGGRSGNRGECAQPCRKKYSLIDSNNKIISDKQHLLSLKDLNLSCYIKELIEAGITSFKIEGRLKDINYIKNTVAFYRKKIDEVLENTRYKKSSSGETFIDFIPDPYKTFNRGYSEYFLNIIGGL
jgi:putative protease